MMMQWRQYEAQIGLAGAIIFFLFVFVHEVNNFNQSRRLLIESDTQPVHTLARNTTYLPPITSLYLFGRAPRATNTLAPSQFKLLAIFLETPDSKSSAAIAINNQPEELYKIGAELKGGGKILSIARDHVVILRNGQEEKLVFNFDERSNFIPPMYIPPNTDYQPPEEPNPAEVPATFRSPGFKGNLFKLRRGGQL